jgi:hypothetical protein
MTEEEEGCGYFRNPGLKRTFRVNGFTKTVTLHLRSIRKGEGEIKKEGRESRKQKERE